MFVVALMIAQAAAARPSVTDNRIPETELIAKLESRIVMPQGANALGSYNRAYTEATVNGKVMVFGQMIDHDLAGRIARDRHQPAPPPIRRALMKEIQPAFDGGCLIVNVIYEVGADSVSKIFCNPAGPQSEGR